MQWLQAGVRRAGTGPAASLHVFAQQATAVPKGAVKCPAERVGDLPRRLGGPAKRLAQPLGEGSGLDLDTRP